MDYKWKIQTCNQYGATCVAYIDARDVMDRLDNVVGPQGWQSQFYSLKEHIYCKIGLKVGEEWVWKSDVGVEAGQANAKATEDIKVKGEASDAFKRAAVHWGIGRFLYDMEFVKVGSMKNQQGFFKPFHNPKTVARYKPQQTVPFGLTDQSGMIWDVDKYIKQYLNL